MKVATDISCFGLTDDEVMGSMELWERKKTAQLKFYFRQERNIIGFNNRAERIAVMELLITRMIPGIDYVIVVRLVDSKRQLPFETLIGRPIEVNSLFSLQNYTP